MKKWHRLSHSQYESDYEGPRGLIVLIVTLGILMVALALFAVLPSSVQLTTFKVPVLSGL